VLDRLEEAPLTWKKLLIWSSLVAIVVTALVNVVVEPIPPLLVFMALWAGGLLWLRRSTKGPAILLLVVFVLHLALGAPFALPALMLPASGGDFTTTLATSLASLAAIAAAIALLRRKDVPSGDAPRSLAVVLGALFLVGAAFSVKATLDYEDATAQEGDLQLAAENIDFTEGSLEASPGEVSVFVDNKDATLHTFTIDELGVDLDLPASSAARVSFSAEPGTYEFYCEPHKDVMQGTLTIR
jgi:plastocyanin